MTIMISSLLTFTVLMILKSRSKLISLKKIFFVSFIIFYIFNVTATSIYSEYLEYMLNSFDLDGDTMFSKAEQTQEQKEAMIALTNDTGRSLAWGLSLLYSLIFSGAMLIIYKFTSIKR